MNILIADDDLISRRLLEATLVRFGHQVVAVADGKQALDVMCGADSPRLAILDWMMPVVDGLEVCRQIRLRPGPYVYVVLLTSRDRPEDMVTGLDAEADDFLTKPFDAIELGARLRSGERVLGLQERLLQAQEELRREATFDRLTGVWNRAMILDHLEQELQRSAREAKIVSVVMADVDHFKCVNDTYGHATGDAVLKEVAERLRRVCREYERLGRYGGEEFLLTLPGCDLEIGKRVAERARETVAANPVVVGHRSLTITLSLGVASTQRTPPDSTMLIQVADEALYRAKALGRNRVEV